MTKTKHAMHVQSCSFAYKPINVFFFITLLQLPLAGGRGDALNYLMGMPPPLCSIVT